MRLNILPQINHQLSGAETLRGIYAYYGEDISMDDLVVSTTRFSNRRLRPLALAIDALERGYAVTVHCCDTRIFDLSWMGLVSSELKEKLEYHKSKADSVHLTQTFDAYIQILEKGGTIDLSEINRAVIRKAVELKAPIIAAVSATHLFHSKREYLDSKDRPVLDDAKGKTAGHLVAVTAWVGKEITLHDPYLANPITGKAKYKVYISRLMRSILLGVLSYDAQMVVITKK